MSKPRVMYILYQYPQISETYMESEIEALLADYEVGVITIEPPDVAYKHHHPFRQIADAELIRAAVEEFRPHVLHSHWISDHTAILIEVSRRLNVPFTIRTHSFDVLWKKPSWPFGRQGGVPAELAHDRAAINGDLCLGILAFPFAVPRLEKAGIRRAKIHACYPVINYERFYDRSPNGAAVMGVGACLPKKKMENFLSLAAAQPGVEFNLYAMGYNVEQIRQQNEARGNPVRLMPPIEPREMPREYKKHQWLILTADHKIGTVGWSLGVAEAQASGVGVCVPNLRPDLREYVGDCGFIYDSLDEVKEIISQPFPEKMRQQGFEQAKKSDIQRHKTILTDLWRPAIQSH